MFRPIYFVWVIVPVLLYFAFLAWGLPSIAWNYSWRSNGTHDPFEKRWYVRCDYLGYYGIHTYFPKDGKCPWFKFYKSSEAANVQ